MPNGQDEFTETPFAASFGPVPVVYRNQGQPQPAAQDKSIGSSSSQQAPQNAPYPLPGSVQPAKMASPVQPLAQWQNNVSTSGTSVVTPPVQVPPQRSENTVTHIPSRHTSSRRSQVPNVNKVVMDDTMKESLVAVEKLSQVDPEDAEEWDSTVGFVVEGLRSIQSKWNILEAERKILTKPLTIPQTQNYSGRGGVRRRGRGRGRRRGRWRGV